MAGGLREGAVVEIKEDLIMVSVGAEAIVEVVMDIVVMPLPEPAANSPGKVDLKMLVRGWQRQMLELRNLSVNMKAFLLS